MPRMPLYFMVLDGGAFHERLTPALAASWARRSFAPLLPLAEWLQPVLTAARLSFFTGADEPLWTRVAELSFERRTWRLLVGEVLLLAAHEVPELETAPDTLRHLLAPATDAAAPRPQTAAIDQAHFGSRDLCFGAAPYRPDHAGLNDRADVQRLADYLAGLDVTRWRPDDLAGLPDLADDADRAEELDFVREWLPALTQLYQRAADRQQIIVCEVI